MLVHFNFLLLCNSNLDTNIKKGGGGAEEMHAPFLGKGRAKSYCQAQSAELPSQRGELGLLLWGSEGVPQKVTPLHSSVTLK